MDEPAEQASHTVCRIPLDRRRHVQADEVLRHCMCGTPAHRPCRTLTRGTAWFTPARIHGLARAALLPRAAVTARWARSCPGAGAGRLPPSQRARATAAVTARP